MIKHLAMLTGICAMAFSNVATADQDDNPDWSKQQQQAAGSSGLGESCRRKTDCKEGLKCLRRVCTDPHEGETCGATADCGGGELRCINDKCTNPSAPTGATSKPVKPEGNGDEGDKEKGASSAPSAPGDWMKFRLDDGQLHAFIGITGLLGGFSIVGADAGVGAGLNFGTVGNALLFALKAGIIIGGHHELAIELTPFFTANVGIPPGNGTVFETNVSYGYLIPIVDHVSWPLRLGVGLMAGPSPNALDNAWFEVRADLVGLQINVGHLVIDLHLPSFRYFVTSSNGATGHILNWDFGAGFGYAF